MWNETQTLILDLGGNDDDEYEWIESTLEKDEHPGNNTSMVLTKDGFLHFINANKDRSTHFKVHLSTFLPLSIYKKYAHVL